MSDPTGMPTFSESPKQYLFEENARAAKWAHFSQETEDWLGQAITALRKASQAASQVPVPVLIPGSPPDLVTTLERDRALRFMQRLTLCLTLIEMSVEDLRSTSQMSPVEDASV